MNKVKELEKELGIKEFTVQLLMMEFPNITREQAELRYEKWYDVDAYPSLVNGILATKVERNYMTAKEMFMYLYGNNYSLQGLLELSLEWLENDASLLEILEDHDGVIKWDDDKYTYEEEDNGFI